MITLKQLPEGHPGRTLLTGRTIWFAAQSDQRFSYGIYVPTSYSWDAELPVVVVVHSTDRDAQLERELWVDFAESHRTIIVTPLFPAAIGHPDDLDNYKGLEYQGIRFDLVLLGMLDEVRSRWNADVDRFVLTGHSGGAQFAQRFLLIHPRRLSAVAISAPGRITRIDPESPWPRGTADVATRFGLEVDLDGIRIVPVLLTIGEQDIETGELEAQNDPSQDGFGVTRVARLETLRQNLHSCGVEVNVVTASVSGHRDNPTTTVVQGFVGDILRRLL